MKQSPVPDEAAGSPGSPEQRPARSIGVRAVGNAAMLLVARVASRAIALVTVFATANELLPARNGEFQTTVTYVALISILLDLGFNTLYTREGARNPEQIPHYLRSVLSTRAVFAVPALAALAVTMWVSGFQSLLLPAFVVMLLSAYSNVLRSTFYALGTLSFEAYAILAESVVLLGGTVFGVLTHRGVDFFLWSYAASYAFSCGYFVIVLTARRMVAWRWEFDLSFLRAWLPKSLPFALAFIITTLYFKIDQPILLHFRGLTEVGWYVFAYKPIEALLFVPITLLNVAFPVLAVYHSESRERLLGATTRFYRALLGVGWPLSVGTVMLAPGINGLFDRSAQHQFGPAAAALQILGAGIFLMFTTNAFIAALNAMNRQVLFSWAAGVSLVVNVGLNIFLIPAYGFRGAAWATNLTELALLLTGWLMVRRVLGPVPLARVSWRILLAGLLMAGALYFFRAAHGWQVLLAILIGMVVYGFGLFLFRALEPEELTLARRALLRRG